MNIFFALIWFPLDSAATWHIVLFLILIFSGIGLPIPEEVTLILGGYLAYLGFIDFWTTLYVLTLGIIVADIMGYALGKYFGKWISEKLSRFRLCAAIIYKIQQYFNRYGARVVCFSRPFLGIRVLFPILAGHFRMKFWKFLIFDILGAIPWTFFLVFASYYLGLGIDFITEVREIKYIVFGILISAILVFSLIRFLRNKYFARLV